MGRLSAMALAAAAVAAVATVAAATHGPTPTPKLMKITNASGQDCINQWYVSGRDVAAGKWVWADETRCCPPRVAPKTMTVFRGGKRCTSTWTQCDTALNDDGNCVRKWCDATVCAEPVCPPTPPVMKTRYVRRGGERCVKTWSACGKRLSRGVCTWKGCDVVRCQPPCAKPAAKTMRSQSAGRVCVDHWWPATLSVDTSKDGMDCKWGWKDVKVCHCRDGNKPVWKRC
ncbi:hypothetical protein BU14_0577s0005 [Porphyra umbilicalis]|uniref:Uncharacterized protein n=1 Tax=Porphyra umbilicalis TaxID=2786 RepID=A0A1X6NRJ5_PORUM|nr:hypothetical protein BU14_0577s0005 [Porphyra umbilicalis]|eukprot:OSX71205.1 hypothetical protein BU14_0577s0005 [Porphyra umbilicalis]